MGRREEGRGQLPNHGRLHSNSSLRSSFGTRPSSGTIAQPSSPARWRGAYTGGCPSQHKITPGSLPPTRPHNGWTVGAHLQPPRCKRRAVHDAVQVTCQMPWLGCLWERGESGLLLVLSSP
ncbi:hypothetical protein HBI73_214850 [Parastagonospora nodorum]|nr:hypothetical protein HBI73_214850 [Parastagonospora nodorum]